MGCSIASRIRFYLRILFYFRADGWLVTRLVLLIWLALGLGTLGPAIIAVLTDTVLSGKPAANPFARLLLDFLPGSKTALVIALAAVWLTLQAANETLTMAREMINNRLRYNGTSRVRMSLFDHLQQLSPSYHRSRPQGDSIYRLSSDTLGFFGVLNTFIGAANSVIAVFAVGAVMLGWNARMTAAALVLAPLLVLANVFFGRLILRTSAASKQADADFTTFVQRAIASVGLVQLFGCQDAQSQRFRGAVDQTVRAGMRMNWQEQLYPLAQRLIYAMGYGFVLAYGGYLVCRDQAAGAAGGFTVGGILAMTAYLGQLWDPLRRITGFTADVQGSVAACNRVFHVLDQSPAVRDAGGARPLAVRPRTLELSHVRFGYIPNRLILCGVTARVEPGEMVAFVGASGAGKSTLLTLLARFYDPSEGAVRLDRHDLRDVRLADVRRHIALVPQEGLLVAGTIAENIAFADPSASHEQVRNAAELADAAPLIEALPGGFDAALSEGGQNCPGALRQRLAIARALLTQAPILVLDEPTSGLDRHNQRQILQTLRRLKGRRTIVLMTHSLEAAAQCEHIFVLSGGRIAEQGTHEALLLRGGAYAAMSAMPHLAAEEESALAA